MGHTLPPRDSEPPLLSPRLQHYTPQDPRIHNTPPLIDSPQKRRSKKQDTWQVRVEEKGEKRGSSSGRNRTATGRASPNR